MSSSSVEREIKNVRRIVEAHSLKLVRKQGSLSIEGNEHDKRSLIGSLVSQEAVNSMSRYGGLSEYFDDMDISRVRTCTLSVIENQGTRLSKAMPKNLITLDRRGPLPHATRSARARPGMRAIRSRCREKYRQRAMQHVRAPP